ncbi:MAG: class IV adenylate cyclase [Gemmataceae bacterium]
MLEIEQKFRLTGNEPIEAGIAEMGAITLGEIMEEDHYFNAPDRDFAKTGEAFRIRRIGDKNFLTYKGPKLQQEVKVRRELEIDIVPGQHAFENFRELLLALGYKFVAVVRKNRTEWKFKLHSFDMALCLDKVEKLGQFMEVEIVTGESQVDQASALVKQIATKLGLVQLEPRSYLRMLLEKEYAG